MMRNFRSNSLISDIGNIVKENTANIFNGIDESTPATIGRKFRKSRTFIKGFFDKSTESDNSKVVDQSSSNSVSEEKINDCRKKDLAKIDSTSENISKSHIAVQSNPVSDINMIRIELNNENVINSRVLNEIARQIYQNNDTNKHHFHVIIINEKGVSHKFSVTDIKLDFINKLFVRGFEDSELSINNDLFKLNPKDKNATVLKTLSHPANIKNLITEKFKSTDNVRKQKQVESRIDEDDMPSTPHGSFIGLTNKYLSELSEEINMSLTSTRINSGSTVEISTSISELDRSKITNLVNNEALGRFTDKLNIQELKSYISK